VDTHDKQFRQRFMLAAQREQARLRACFSQVGVDCLELSTDDDLLDALVRFTQMRRGRGAAAPLPAQLNTQSIAVRTGT
jgi:uncharacterized protein (DUF58 family)